MKGKQLLDLTYILHLLLAAILINELSRSDFEDVFSDIIGGRGVAFLSFSLLAGTVLILLATLGNYKRKELWYLLVLLVITAVIGETIVGLAYLATAIFVAGVWFFKLRK